MANILSEIAADAVKDWTAAEKAIDADVAKVVAAVPGLETEVTNLANDVKQGASDILGAAGTFLGNGAKPLTAGIETAADAALAGLGSGAASILDPIANNAINLIVTMGISSLQAWALSAKAKLSAVPAQSTSIPASPPPE